MSLSRGRFDYSERWRHLPQISKSKLRRVGQTLSDMKLSFFKKEKSAGTRSSHRLQPYDHRAQRQYRRGLTVLDSGNRLRLWRCAWQHTIDTRIAALQACLEAQIAISDSRRACQLDDAQAFAFQLLGSRSAFQGKLEARRFAS